MNQGETNESAPQGLATATMAPETIKPDSLVGSMMSMSPNSQWDKQSPDLGAISAQPPAAEQGMSMSTVETPDKPELTNQQVERLEQLRKRLTESTRILDQELGALEDFLKHPGRPVAEKYGFLPSNGEIGRDILMENLGKIYDGLVENDRTATNKANIDRVMANAPQLAQQIGTAVEANKANIMNQFAPTLNQFTNEVSQLPPTPVTTPQTPTPPSQPVQSMQPNPAATTSNF